MFSFITNCKLGLVQTAILLPKFVVIMIFIVLLIETNEYHITTMGLEPMFRIVTKSVCVGHNRLSIFDNTRISS